MVSSRAIVITMWEDWERAYSKKLDQYCDSKCWRWHIQGMNGKIVGGSTQPYNTRAACIHGMALVLRLTDRDVDVNLRESGRFKVETVFGYSYAGDFCTITPLPRVRGKK